jgi:hypothetical protein
MIECLGKIDIPQRLIDDVKNREPDRIASHVAGASHKMNVQEMDRSKYNVDNYKHYDNDRCQVQEYCKDWYVDILSNEFLEQHKLNKPSNAIVLRVEPGTFSVPHFDRFRHALREHPELEFEDIARLWIPIEDSTFGQAFFVGDQVIHKYSAGEVYTFSNYDFHSAANAGLDTRYTLIVYTTKSK